MSDPAERRPSSGRRRPVRVIAATALLATLATGLAACGSAERSPGGRPPAAPAEAEGRPPPSPPSEPEPPAATPPAATPAAPGGELPPAVEATRDAILAAARALDYAGLEALVDPAAFTYSFGESGDPAGYWRRLEAEAHVPVLGDILPVVLGLPFARQDGVYVWPSVHAKAPADWTEEERRALEQLYGPEEIRSFEELGAYAGWRVGIRKDGTWLFFVAGD